MPNRLAGETSPYLLQHKDNPVDWYPWGPEALQRAKDEDRPILLSVGYSACHWCHVMAHESFQDPVTAEVMNRLFVNIKVDREERPDLDNIYMQAVQALTGRGGWPMTVFLTPDGRPFYGGTYFPPDDREGMASFKRVMVAVAQGYKSRRSEVLEGADEIVGRLRQRLQGTGPVADLGAIRAAAEVIQSQFDETNGGFGGAPKFPQAMTLEFLLRAAVRYEDQACLNMVEFTLHNMFWGGIYDQLGGGFHRYSTDERWLVPHFEKMLYDNALLGRLYVHTYQFTGNPVYIGIIQHIFDYVLREMSAVDGGFYSAQDADSEGVEGKFYVWTRKEIMDALGEVEGRAVCAYFGVTDAGNLDGKNVLYIPGELPNVAAEAGLSEQLLLGAIDTGIAKLLRVRNARVHPGRDEKILTSWNSMMIRSLAEAGATLGREDYAQAASDAATFLLSHLRKDGRVLRSYKGKQGPVKGYLEDYAALADALMAMYEVSFDRHWLDDARGLCDQMIALFWEEADGIFYDTANDQEGLVIRPRDVYDNATPCGNSLATDVLLRLSVFTGNEDYRRKALSNLQSISEFLPKHPAGFGHWLAAADFALSSPYEIAVVGARSDPKTQELLEVIYREYFPSKVLAAWDPTTTSAQAVADLPLLRDRPLVKGAPAAYVCEHYTCKEPATDPVMLARQLGLTPEPKNDPGTGLIIP